MKKRDDVVTRVVTAESCLLQDVEGGICSTPLTVQAALSLSVRAQMRHHLVPLWNTIGVTVAIFEFLSCSRGMPENIEVSPSKLFRGW